MLTFKFSGLEQWNLYILWHLRGKLSDFLPGSPFPRLPWLFWSNKRRLSAAAGLDMTMLGFPLCTFRAKRSAVEERLTVDLIMRDVSTPLDMTGDECAPGGWRRRQRSEVPESSQKYRGLCQNRNLRIILLTSWPVRWRLSEIKQHDA